MVQLEASVLEQKIQTLRTRLQGEDDDLQRENENRRRPGRMRSANPNLVPLLRGEAVPYRLLNDETDPPYGIEHTTPMLGIAVSVISSIPLLGVLGLVAWAMLR